MQFFIILFPLPILYAVYEINALGGADELRAITHSQKAAEKIAEILESDHLVS